MPLGMFDHSINLMSTQQGSGVEVRKHQQQQISNSWVAKQHIPRFHGASILILSRMQPTPQSGWGFWLNVFLALTSLSRCFTFKRAQSELCAFHSCARTSYVLQGTGRWLSGDQDTLNSSKQAGKLSSEDVSPLHARPPSRSVCFAVRQGLR